MLQAILSNNDGVDTVSEPWIMLPFLSIFKPSLIDAKYDFNLAIDAFFDFQKKVGGIESFKVEYKDFILRQYAKIQSKMENLVLDKTPRYYEIFDHLYEFFPKAKYIILKRHPLAVLSSIMKTWNRFTMKDLELWHKRDILVAPKILLDLEKKYSDKPNVQVFKYEDLVADIHNQVSQLYHWLGISFSEEVLHYSNNESYKGKYGDQVGATNNSTPNNNSADDWKLRLNNPQYKSWLDGYGAFLGLDFLKEYGYQDTINYKESLRFRLFVNYCFRKDQLTKPSWKDNIVRKLIKHILKEDI